MKNNRQRRRLFYLSIPLGAVILLIVQAFCYWHMQSSAVRMLDSDTDSITLMRLQALQEKKAPIALLGSSQTERLQSSADCIVIGVPGSSFMAGWQYFVKDGNYNSGTILMLEGNLSLNGTTEGIIERTQEYFFKLLASSPNFSQAARPSTMLLSKIASYLFARDTDARFAQEQALDQERALSLEQLEMVSSLNMDGDLRERLHTRIDAILAMKKAGFKPCFIFYPTRYQTKQDLDLEQARLSCVRYMAQQANIPLFNYLKADFAAQLQFSDTHHLRSTHISTSMLRNTIMDDVRGHYKSNP